MKNDRLFPIVLLSVVRLKAQMNQGKLCSILLCMLLVLSVSWSIDLASKTHCHMEDLLMVRTVMAYGSVFRDLAPLLLPVFLKLGLVVFIGDTVSDDLLNLERNEGKHIFPCLLKALVQVDTASITSAWMAFFMAPP